MIEKRISVKVHPAAARWLMLTQKVNGDAVEITDKTVKAVFESCLGRKNFTGRAHISKLYEKRFRKLTIKVSDRAFYRLGFMMTPYWQCVFSAYVYNRLMEEICLTMMCNALSGRANRTWTAEELLIEYGITDELNAETVRKHYLRHWRGKEDAVRSMTERAGERERREKTKRK